ncbi:hypothetical protein NTH44_003105 [Vibrio metoecus]|nr:hypothetical protein [Vibrio cholerae]
MKTRGATVVEVSLALAISITVGLMLIVPLKKFTTEVSNTWAIERFTHETFIGMKLYYHNFVSTNGGCYNVAPPTITAGQLVTQGLIDVNEVQDSFFLADLAQLSFQTNNSFGKVDSMSITVNLPEGTQSYSTLANLVSRTNTTLTFQKPIDFSTDHFITSNISNSFCKGP